MSEVSFWVEGEPATFATASESPWKNSLFKFAQPPSLDGRETGLDLRFSVSSLRRKGKPFDIDNLCDPVFAVLIGKAGWFGGRKTALSWWTASKSLGQPSGCHIAVHANRSFTLPTQGAFWDEIYTGPLPDRATSPELARWALDLSVERGVNWIPENCVLYLGFADANLNIGEIATGRVKPAVDCLYPWLGGTARDPHDWRVETLIVERALEHLPKGAIHVRLWDHGRLPAALIDTPPPPKKASTHKPTILGGTVTNVGTTIHNPCREDTALWIVCQAAIEGRTLLELRADLELHASGAGRRLLEYKSDLRNQKKLDICIEGDRITCYGPRHR